MRVTHLGKFYPPVPGGMERVLQSLAEGERARGLDTRALVAATARRTLHETVNGVPVTRVASMLRVGSVWFAPALTEYVMTAFGVPLKLTTDVFPLQIVVVPLMVASGRATMVSCTAVRVGEMQFEAVLCVSA